MFRNAKLKFYYFHKNSYFCTALRKKDVNLTEILSLAELLHMTIRLRETGAADGKS